MNNAYGEEEETDTITISNLRYYPANSTKNSEPYVTTDITYHFEMDIQGSSTKGFKHNEIFRSNFGNLHDDFGFY